MAAKKATKKPETKVPKKAVKKAVKAKTELFTSTEAEQDKWDAAYEEFEKRFKWWRSGELRKEWFTQKKVTELVFPLSFIDEYQQSVTFPKPVTIMDALLAADKQLSKPLTKKIWNELRDPITIDHSLNPPQKFVYEDLTKKNGYFQMVKKLRMGDLLRSHNLIDKISQSTTNKNTFFVYLN